MTLCGDGVVIFLGGRIIKFTGRRTGGAVMGAVTVWRGGTVVTVGETEVGRGTGVIMIIRGAYVVVSITGTGWSVVSMEVVSITGGWMVSVEVMGITVNIGEVVMIVV
jgi:hypothetical protein